VVVVVVLLVVVVVVYKLFILILNDFIFSRDCVSNFSKHFIVYKEGLKTTKK